ncbi:MAG: hypothetical protein M1834_006367 [Cirrosporium novae-zelandiae]|nr:MAG: hypothetical protein M1834_006367 [Cirrosporium novae-zelandiae]
MSDDSNPQPTSQYHNRRRASFSPGQALSDLFTRTGPGGGPPAGTPALPGSIATAAANAQQRRRVSVSTSLGLSGSPTQPFGFGRTGGRRGSISSASSASPTVDENAIDEGDESPNVAAPASFARRLSFGAQALRERVGSGNNTARAKPTTRTRNASNSVARPEGFNWSENFRSRAERGSISGPVPSNANQIQPPPRRATVATTPANEPPTPPKKEPVVPDHFQERILKGDFYMD